MTTDPNVVEQDADHRLPRDPRLNVLLHLTHTGAVADVAITIVSGGTVFSGTLVSLARWRELSMEQVEGSGTLEGLVKGLTSVGELADDEDEDAPTPAYEVLHLSDVQMRSGASTALKGGVLRLATDAVDGWMFGSFQFVESD